jgi:hypothetical protein
MPPDSLDGKEVKDLGGAVLIPIEAIDYMIRAKVSGFLVDSIYNYLIWCGRGDLNPHAFRRHPLKMVCLPIPPLPLGLMLCRWFEGCLHLQETRW